MAGNNKHRKGHKEKVAKRNRAIQEAKNKQNKLMQQYFNQIKEMQTQQALEVDTETVMEDIQLLPEAKNISDTLLKDEIT